MNELRQLSRLISALVLSVAVLSACADEDGPTRQGIVETSLANESKSPSPTTLAVLEEAKKNLPIGDFADGTLFRENTNEILLARLPDTVISLSEEEQALYMQDDDLATVHPSLLRYIRGIVRDQGVYQLAEGVYQIRGDLSHITLIRGDTGWVFLDVGTSVDFSGAAWQFAKTVIPEGEILPVKAVIYSHSHGDHFGGVKGIIAEEDVIAGSIEIIAPHGFKDEVISESVILGPAMRRRAAYHFGTLITTKEDGSERVYLPFLEGASSMIPPTVELAEGPGEITKRVIDGIEIEFMDISGGEAPASTLIYVPEFSMLFNSELFIPGLHNVYTLRGAKTRDALRWSKYINQVIVTYGNKIDLMTGPHGPSFNGKERAVEYMKAQRDNYGLIHNQAVRLANSGVKISDVGEAVDAIVPRSLSQLWHTHGYHGTYSHNARAVVNYYLGYYDGNPAQLNPLTGREEAAKFVEYMGGEDAILERAQADFEKGEYRFVATALDKLVAVAPDTSAARNLLADCYEQLGFQAEGPQWRNAYLSAAKELRSNQILTQSGFARSSEILRVASAENMLDLLAVSIDPIKADGLNIQVNLRLKDDDEFYFLELSHGNLSSIKTVEALPADATLLMTRQVFFAVLTGSLSVEGASRRGDLEIEGDQSAFPQILATRSAPPQPFNLVPLGNASENTTTKN